MEAVGETSDGVSVSTDEGNLACEEKVIRIHPLPTEGVKKFLEKTLGGNGGVLLMDPLLGAHSLYTLARKQRSHCVPPPKRVGCSRLAEYKDRRPPSLEVNLANTKRGRTY